MRKRDVSIEYEAKNKSNIRAKFFDICKMRNRDFFKNTPRSLKLLKEHINKTNNFKSILGAQYFENVRVRDIRCFAVTGYNFDEFIRRNKRILQTYEEAEKNLHRNLERFFWCENYPDHVYGSPLDRDGLCNYTYVLLEEVHDMKLLMFKDTEKEIMKRSNWMPTYIKNKVQQFPEDKTLFFGDGDPSENSNNLEMYK